MGIESSEATSLELASRVGAPRLGGIFYSVENVIG